MEYLTISGTLRLKKTVDNSRLNRLLDKINNIQFDRHGLVLIERQDARLSIEADGGISEEVGVDVISWLYTLKEMATSSSFIVVDRVRWEMNITLDCNGCQPNDTSSLLSSFVRSHDNNKLILL